VGETESFPQAGFDPSAIWMVKLDSLGAIAWQRQYAGTEPRHGWAVQQTFDGGYLSADTKGHIIKVDSVGSLQWQRDFKSVIESVSLTADSGFVLCLLTYAFTTDDPLYGTAWFVKVTRNGEIEWQKYYHPGHAPWSLIRPAPDGGFVAWVYTKPGNVILKLDSTGTPNGPRGSAGTGTSWGGCPLKSVSRPTAGVFCSGELRF